MRSDPSTPQPRLPLGAVQRALRETTEYLARELAQPQARAPEWSEFQWRIARAVVTIHGVSGLLVAHSRWPPGWQAFLVGQRAQIARRLQRIEALRDAVGTAACERGVPLLALKGAALQAQGIYAPGERPMSDLDLLVKEAHVGRATELLNQLGFRPGHATWKHQVFEPEGAADITAEFGEDSANPIKIELHGCIREILPLRPVELTQLVWPGTAAPGINDYASRASLLLHLLLHASGTLILRQIRLLHLHDIARLTRGMNAADWEELFREGRQTSDPGLWWAYPPLLLTNRYFGCVPQGVLERLAADCHSSLRRSYRGRVLSDVSLSYLWITAFPGIEWSRSPREMLAYVAQRLRPAPETLALRETFAAIQPRVSGGEWAHTSQARRMVRWLLARQPRQESLNPVRFSLARALS